MFRFTILLRKRWNQVSEIGDFLLDAANFTDRRGKSSPTDSAKPVGAGATSQPLILRGRTIWIVDAHRDDGRRFVVHADEKLTAFLELERAVCIHLLTEDLLR